MLPVLCQFSLCMCTVRWGRGMFTTCEYSPLDYNCSSLFVAMTPQLAMRMGLAQRVPSHCCYPDDWSYAGEIVRAYQERILMFASANAMEKDKVVLTSLTVIVSMHYTLIWGLTSSDLFNKVHDDLVSLLKKHFNPEPIIIAQHLQFYWRDRKMYRRSPTTLIDCNAWLAGIYSAPSAMNNINRNRGVE